MNIYRMTLRDAFGTKLGTHLFTAPRESLMALLETETEAPGEGAGRNFLLEAADPRAPFQLELRLEAQREEL